jgi:uncharacterized protein (DUF362 family)/Pyruvate/2-oxoacid:ferredoxin oxidoreductase delta subunit
MLARVSFRSCPTYDPDAVRDAVRDVIDQCGGLGGLLRPGARVLLKPNVVNPQPPDSAVCTHPMVVRAVAEIAREAGCSVIVADQPCYAMTRTVEYALGVPGYIEALAGLEAEMRLLNTGGYDTVEVRDGYHLGTVAVSRLAREADVIINLGKCKTHLQCLLTGAVKNMFGLLAPKQRLVAHSAGSARALGEAVADIYSACRPHFSITDAVVGMEGHGPTAGEPRQIGFLAASTDAVALDAVVETTVGFRPGEIVTTLAADRKGLGCADLAEIAITGDDPADFRIALHRPPRMHQRLPTLLNRLGRHVIYCRPVVDTRACQACGGCKQVCPGDAVRMGRHAFIERRKCLECYCCIEACPFGAIKVSRSFASKLVSPTV